MITSSKTSSAPEASQRRRSASRNPGAGGTQPMFPATGSTKIAARSPPWRSTAAAAALEVVVVDDDGVGDDRGRDAGRGRDAERRQPRAGLGEERVGVAVVAAGELEHAVAAGVRPREPQRRHRRLGPRGDEPHLLDRRHRVDDLRGELDLALGRRAEARAVARRRRAPPRPSRGRRGRRSAAPRTATQSSSRAPVGRLEVGALAAGDEERLVDADRAHRPHRRVDAAGDQLRCARRQSSDGSRARPRAPSPSR